VGGLDSSARSSSKLADSTTSEDGIVSPRKKNCNTYKKHGTFDFIRRNTKRWAKTVIKIRGSASGIGILLKIHLHVAISVIKVAIRERNVLGFFKHWRGSGIYVKAGRMA